MNDYPLGHSSLAICKCRKTNVQISKFELRNILASYSHLNQDHAKKTVLLASANWNAEDVCWGPRLENDDLAVLSAVAL